MGTKKYFTLTTHLDFFVKEFLCRDMFSSVDSFRDFVSKFLLFVFGSVVSYIFRYDMIMINLVLVFVNFMFLVG